MSVKTIFAAFAAAAIALVGCNEKCDVADVIRDSEQTDGETVQLTVTADAPVTKFSTVTDGSTINTIQIFVFDEAGTMEAYVSQAGGNTGTLTCTKGEKTVVVLANVEELSGISTLEELKSMRGDLYKNKAEACIMEGSVVYEVTGNASISVEVIRQVAKIKLNKITLDMAVDYYRSKEFVIKAIYIINVPGDKCFLVDSTPSVWYNKMKAQERVFSLMFNVVDTILDDGATFEKTYSFYSLPNPYTEDTQSETWSERPTRLVVEATIDGELCYYPVTVPDLKSNTEYNVNLTITRPGSSSPDIPVSTYALEVQISVADWLPGTDYEEVI